VIRRLLIDTLCICDSLVVLIRDRGIERETSTKLHRLLRASAQPSAATPGRVFPSSHSRKAPPAVET